jgi:hypothetical protein
MNIKKKSMGFVEVYVCWFCNSSFYVNNNMLLHGEQNEEQEVEKYHEINCFFFCTYFGDMQIELWDIIII